jgi:hypothetical protein
MNGYLELEGTRSLKNDETRRVKFSALTRDC